MKSAYASVISSHLLVLSWSVWWHLWQQAHKDFPKNMSTDKEGLWGFLRGCLAWGEDLTGWSSVKFRQGPNWKFKMPWGEDHKGGSSWAWNMGATQNRLCHAHQDQIMTQSFLKEMPQVRSLPYTNTPAPASRDVSFEVDVLKFMCRSPGMWTMAPCAALV